MDVKPNIYLLNYLCVHALARACVYRQYAAVFFIFLFFRYAVFVYYMCAQIRVWSCMPLFTKIVVCKLLYGLAVVGPETFSFCLQSVSIHVMRLFIRHIVP